jgi:hypothetical protein
MRPSIGRQPRRFATPIAVAVALLLAVSACASGGGGGGGGSGESDDILRVLVVNEHSEVHTLSYSGGEPLADSPDAAEVESCTAAIVWYGVTIPFELLIDGVPVIVSDELPVPVAEGTDLVAQIGISQDGVAAPVPLDTTGSSPVDTGRGVSKPAAIGLCL